MSWSTPSLGRVRSPYPASQMDSPGVIFACATPAFQTVCAGAAQARDSRREIENVRLLILGTFPGGRNRLPAEGTMHQNKNFSESCICRAGWSVELIVPKVGTPKVAAGSANWLWFRALKSSDRN